MAYSLRPSPRTLRSLGEQISRRWPTRTTGNRGSKVPSGTASNDKAVVGETFELWTLTEADLWKPWGRLASVATRTGHLHHQIHLIRQHDAKSTDHFARSTQRVGHRRNHETNVSLVMASHLAGKIAAAISWIDQNKKLVDEDGPDEPLARLLAVPSRLIHALWLADSLSDRILIVDQPNARNNPEVPPITLFQFQAKLQSSAPAGLPVQPTGLSSTPNSRYPKSLRQRVLSTREERDARLTRNIRIFVGIFILTTLLWIAIAASAVSTLSQFAHVLSTCGLLACVSFISGTLLGFIFGIPRSLASTSAAIAQNVPAPGHAPIQTSSATTASFQPRPGFGIYHAAEPPARMAVRPNTNLEQISDWLTKVLVGYGLTQIRQITHFAQQLSDTLGPALDPVSKGGTIAVAIVGAFGIAGFVWAYFESRTTLMQLFSDDSPAPSDFGGSPPESLGDAHPGVLLPNAASPSVQSSPSALQIPLVSQLAPGPLPTAAPTPLTPPAKPPSTRSGSAN